MSITHIALAATKADGALVADFRMPGYASQLSPKGCSWTADLRRTSLEDCYRNLSQERLLT